MDLVHREELHALRPDGPLTTDLPTENHPSSSPAPAVLLVGHGSHLSGDSSRPVHDLADRLRRRGAFPEVRVAFWKEEPQLHFAFDLVERHHVAVVPVFTSEGYFTERVLPRELGLTQEGRGPGGRRVRYCAPVGSHPTIASVVLERADEAADLSEEERGAASLVVIGHGTDRHPHSGGTTYALVERLRSRGRYGEVLPAFLDQDPGLADVLAGARGREVVAVPFFISDGWHAGITIPRDLGARSGGASGAREGRLWYARSVGTHEAMADVVVDLVGDAGDGAGGEGVDPAGWVAPASRAKAAFPDWIRAAEGEWRIYLQTVARAVPGDRFEVRHVEDRDADPEALDELLDPALGVDVATRTADGRHRPLRSAPNLRRGWRFSGLGARELWELYGHFYPALPVHQVEWARGALEHKGFAEVAARQTGMYRGLRELSDEGVGDVVEACCAPERCLRAPTWYHAGGGTASEEGAPGEASGSDRGPPDPKSSDGVFPGVVPCPRPCSIALSEAKQALDLQRESG